MIHLSSYHSNGLPTVVWSNKVNLIGEKVYKPKIHFCENCNKPILIYGRLIPCKHVFCFTCATLCLAQQTANTLTSAADPTALTPPTPGPNEPAPLATTRSHQDNASSPNPNGNTSLLDGICEAQQPSQPGAKGCHRCGGRALRVERNTLNSIFVCQVDSCRRTYLSARDLQAHVTHRHNRNKSNTNSGAASASLAAISSSPYISSSSLLHLNNQTNNHRQSSSSNSTVNNNASNANHHDSPSTHHPNHRERDQHHHQQHHGHSGRRERERHRDRERDRERDRYNRDRHIYQRERERERDSKEYHRQSLQRAAQWAEASAQMLEKGLTR